MATSDNGSVPGSPPRRSRTQDTLADGGKHRKQRLKTQIPSEPIAPDKELEGPEMDDEDEDDSSGDSGDDERKTTSKHYEICKHLGEKSYEEVAELYKYLEGMKKYLSELGTEATFIHVLVRRLRKLKSDSLDSKSKKRRYIMLESAVKGTIPWIVFRYPNLVVERSEDHSKQTAFEEASENFIQAAYYILKLLLDDETKRKLGESCHRHSDTPCSLMTAHPLVELVKAIELTQENDHDWCPHKGSKKILDCHGELEKNLREAASHNPKSSTTCLQHAIREFGYNADGEAVARLVSISDRNMIMAKNSSDTPLISAILQFRNPAEGDKETLERLTRIIQLLVRICPEALDDRSKENNKTAYEELISYKPVSEENEKQIRQVLDILKEAIIGDQTRNHKAKLGYLYPPGVPARRICLDLGLSKPIGARFVNAVVKEIFDDFNFETVLSYVKLPPRISTYTALAKHGQVDILDNYKPIFDFLKKQGVKKIFRVIVNDLTDRPHTDEIIGRLVKEFEVEHWEWKKLDMNSQTILDAAPGVTVVSLHSSGSYSALQGWACEDGLIILKNLNKVEVTIHQGIETHASLTKYKDAFNQSLEDRFKKAHRKLKLVTNLGKPIIEEVNGSDSTANQALTSQNKLNHNWIQHMQTFVMGLNNFHDKKSLVRVALIDDGIDPVEMKFKVVDGKSFNEDDDASDDNYYVEAGPHGTVMSTLILQMCPMVEFYMAKIVPNESSTIPPKAAVKALKWAIEEKKVDIISMSWTFKKAANMGDFEKAINTAVTSNVLLFASLREAEDALVMENFYPVSLEGVFRIGSATRFGNQAETFSGDSKVAHYILPGREVLLKLGAETTEIQGSSVATALAAGLAALILHCADLVDQTNGQTSNTQRGKELRNFTKMKKVFDQLSQSSNKKNYPEVQRYFKMRGEDLALSDITDTVHALTAQVTWDPRPEPA